MGKTKAGKSFYTCRPGAQIRPSQCFSCLPPTARLATSLEGFDIASVAQQRQEQSYFVRLGSLSERLRQRAYEHSLGKLQSTRQRAQEALLQLSQTLSLVRPAVTGGAGQQRVCQRAPPQPSGLFLPTHPPGFAHGATVLDEFAGAAVTQSHTLGSLNTDVYCLTVLEAGSPRSRCWQGGSF